MCLQDPAGRAGRPGARSCSANAQRRPARRTRQPGTTRPWCASRTAPRSLRPPISSHRSSTIHTTSVGSRPPTRSPTSTRWAAGPVVALNLVGWPRDVLPAGVIADILRGGAEIARAAGCHLAGGHSIDDPEPKYGLAGNRTSPTPTGCCATMLACAGQPISLTEAAGHRRAQQPSQGPRARCFRRPSRSWLRSTTWPRRPRSRREFARPPMSPDSVCSATCSNWPERRGVGAVIDAAAVPYLDGAREAVRDGYRQRGTRRNLHWVRPALDGPASQEEELLLLADAQTSGGLLVAGRAARGHGRSASSCRAGRPRWRCADPADRHAVAVAIVAC